MGHNWGSVLFIVVASCAGRAWSADSCQGVRDGQACVSLPGNWFETCLRGVCQDGPMPPSTLQCQLYMPQLKFYLVPPNGHGRYSDTLNFFDWNGSPRILHLRGMSGEGIYITKPNEPGLPFFTRSLNYQTANGFLANALLDPGHQCFSSTIQQADIFLVTDTVLEFLSWDSNNPLNYTMIATLQPAVDPNDNIDVLRSDMFRILAVCTILVPFCLLPCALFTLRSRRRRLMQDRLRSIREAALLNGSHLAADVDADFGADCPPPSYEFSYSCPVAVADDASVFQAHDADASLSTSLPSYDELVGSQPSPPAPPPQELAINAEANT